MDTQAESWGQLLVDTETKLRKASMVTGRDEDWSERQKDGGRGRESESHCCSAFQVSEYHLNFHTVSVYYFDTKHLKTLLDQSHFPSTINPLPRKLIGIPQTLRTY